MEGEDENTEETLFVTLLKTDEEGEGDLIAVTVTEVVTVTEIDMEGLGENVPRSCTAPPLKGLFPEVLLQSDPGMHTPLQKLVFKPEVLPKKPKGHALHMVFSSSSW